MSLQNSKEMNAQALASFFDLYAPAIYRYAFRYCNNEIMADQVVEAAFAKLLERLALGDGPGSDLRSYLFQAAYHRIVDEHRRALPVRPVERTLSADASAGASVEQNLFLERIGRAIRDGLTADQRHVLILRYMEGFSLKETALIMGRTTGRIKVIRNRAVAALRQALERSQVDHGFSEVDLPCRPV